MKYLSHSLVIIFAAVLAWSPQIRAEQGGPGTGEMSDTELDARLKFIGNRIASQRPAARNWQYGWTGFHAASAAGQALLAVDADDSDDEINYLVGAAKSAGALAQMMIKPLPVVQGAIGFHDMPSRTREERIAKLSQGESLLRLGAERASSRTGWKRHLIGIGANLLGGGIIAAFGDGGDAITSTLVGITVAEVNIWTEPSRAVNDLEDYQNKRWSNGQKSRVNWQIIPAHNRLMVKVTF
ncbi:MAG: hypothetical protein OEU62_05655 [Gammaproteobacteria bacterium]|nr:hypothetical protein [Gammaproteobacteria bacterium]